MSDRMTLIPFDQLMAWIFKEKKEQGTVFGVRQAFVAEASKALPIFNEKIETPFGPGGRPKYTAGPKYHRVLLCRQPVF